jgi:Integrase core domain
VTAMTHDGRTVRMLTLIDEYTRECLAIRVARRLGSYEVIEALADVMLWRGIPENVRSDNGPEFVAKELRKWLGNLSTGTLYIEPGSPRENTGAVSAGPDEQIFYPTAPADFILVVRGTRAWIVVPRCGCESMERFPFTSFRRSLMLVRPSPFPFIASPGSKPIPKSRTVSSTSYNPPLSDTSKCREPLCLIAF